MTTTLEALLLQEINKAKKDDHSSNRDDGLSNRIWHAEAFCGHLQTLVVRPGNLRAIIGVHAAIGNVKELLENDGRVAISDNVSPISEKARGFYAAALPLMEDIAKKIPSYEEARKAQSYGSRAA